LTGAIALLVAATAIAILATKSPHHTSTASSNGAASQSRSQPTTKGAPAGWTSYTDPSTGFTIAYPSTWRVQRSGTLTDFRDPASGAYLRVDHQQPPGPSPAGAWQALEPQFAAQYPSYQRIQITPTTFQGHQAAIWEYTYSDGGADLHAVDLGFVTGNYGFALNFQTHAPDWGSMQSTFDRFKSSFKAPS
jgi:hypothetical protein